MKESNTDKIHKNISINISDNDNDLNDYLSSWSEFNSRPSKLTIYSYLSSNIVMNIINDLSSDEDCDINKVTDVIPSDDGKFSYTTKYFIKINKDIFVTFIEIDNGLDDDALVNNITIYYNHSNISPDDLNDTYISKFGSAIINLDELDDNNFNILRLSENGYEVEPYPIDVSEDSDYFKLYFNDDIIKSSNRLIRFLNKENKGLSLLYGDRGSGKSIFINHIINKTKKFIIYIPIGMIEHTINSPDFLFFLRRYNNSIIIIDDCEIYFNKLYKKTSLYTSNLLQIIDGLVSETLDIQIILGMNSDREEIDSNILNSDCLSHEIRFDKLNPIKATELSEKIGKNKSYDSPVKLSKVLNGKNEQFSRIGF